MSIYKIDDRMYEQDITLIFNTTSKQFGGYLKKNFGVNRDESGSDGSCLKIVTITGIKYIIWLEEFSWRVDEYGILSHEVFHCVHFIFDEIGFRLSDDSVEAYCYYYQLIFQECIAGIKEKTKR